MVIVALCAVLVLTGYLAWIKKEQKLFFDYIHIDEIALISMSRPERLEYIKEQHIQAKRALAMRSDIVLRLMSIAETRKEQEVAINKLKDIEKETADMIKWENRFLCLKSSPM